MKFEKLSGYLDGLYKNYGIPFNECRVFKKDKMVYNYRSDNLIGDVYYIFSMTKLVTSVAVMQLIEKKELSYDDNVEEYLPEFSEMFVKTGQTSVRTRKKIKVIDLLSMQGGMNYDLETKEICALRRNKSDASTRDIVKAIAYGALECEPGTAFEYSLCYDVLGALVEAVTKKSFGEYLKKNIFTPLGMNDTSFHLTENLKQRLLPQYRRIAEKSAVKRLDKPFEKFILSTNYEGGGAGLISTFDDYCKFATAIGNGGKNILTEESVDEIRNNRLTDEMLKKFMRYKWGYGYGFGVRTMVNNTDFPMIPKGSFELTGAAGCYAAFDLENELTIVYFQHVLGVPEIPEIVHHTIRDIVYNEIFVEERI